MNAKADEVAATVKLDLGCGPNPIDGFVGVDSREFNEKVKKTDLSAKRWIFSVATLGDVKLIPVKGKKGEFYLPDNSVVEARCSHFLEHLTASQRVGFFNELYRVLTPNSGCMIITPHWASNRAYGDFTHQWPPVSEMMYFYLSREWRKANAPHTDIEWNVDGYDCHFEAAWGNGMHPAILSRHSDHQQYACSWYKEAIQDLHATVKAIKQ